MGRKIYHTIQTGMFLIYPFICNICPSENLLFQPNYKLNLEGVMLRVKPTFLSEQN